MTIWKKHSRVTGHCPGNAPGESQPVTSPEKGDTMKKKTSIMLSARDKRLLELISEKDARSQTKELEHLIRRRAEELDIKIKEP